ncbi:MAG TPA: TIR domain-containing protein [Sphingomicrobium sp.]
MADVFLSYARADRARVEPLVRALEGQGFSVWWDPHIAPGQEFDELIAKELQRAACVLAVWTENSVASRWVRGEARDAADRGVLLPVRFGQVQLPVDARAIHTIDLDGWNDDPQSPAFQSIASGIRSLLKPAPTAAAESERPQSSKPAVCVLPFENISGDPEQTYFSDGITEDIITDLSHVSSLDVTSRNSAFTYKGRAVSIPEIARQLGVSHVLEGSVRKAGNRVRITAQLIEGATDKHLWAERYDRDLDDIFAVQDDISRSIVAALKVRLGASESRAIAQRGTSSPDAYRFYLMARRYWVGGWARRRDLIIRLCEKALQIDPQYARAWALLSICQADLRFSADNSGQYGLEAADRALQLDPNLADAHAAKARILLARGNVDESWEYHRRALELDPESYEVNVGAARWAIYTHRPEQALVYLTTASNADSSDVWAPGMAIQTYEEAGDQEGALAAARECLARAEKVLESEPDNGNVLGFGVGALIRLGEVERARDWAELVMLVEPGNSNSVYNTACGMAKAGEADLALELLTRVMGGIGKEGFLWVREDSDWASLHGDPRFEALIAETERRLAAEQPDAEASAGA